MKTLIKYRDVAVVLEHLTATIVKIEVMTDEDYAYLLNYISAGCLGDRDETNLVLAFILGITKLRREI